MTALLALSIDQSGQVPSALLDAARTSPFGFVASLVRAGVPTGIEVHESDARLARPVQVPPEGTTTPLVVVLEAFNQSHPEYRATVATGGVVNIRPTEAKVSFLDSPASLLNLKVHGIMMAINKLFEPLQTTRLPGLGIGGSAMGSVAEDRGEETEITLDTVDRTVLEALNGLVLQSPAHAWMVITKEPQTEEPRTRVARVGFIHASGTVTEQVIR